MNYCEFENLSTFEHGTELFFHLFFENTAFITMLKNPCSAVLVLSCEHESIGHKQDKWKAGQADEPDRNIYFEIRRKLSTR